MNAAELLLANGPEAQAALECGSERVTYGELRDAAARAAGLWRDLGLRAGDRVAVWAADGIDWVVAWLGAVWAGGVPIGIDPRLAAGELLPLVEEAQAGQVWCAPEAAAELADAAAARGGAVGIVEAGAVWRSRMRSAPRIAPVARGTQDPAFWIGTSGTTGRPKAVVHGQRAVEHCHLFAREVLGVDGTARLYATSKLFFAYALANGLFAGLRLGATVILDGEWPSPERVLEQLSAHRPSVFFSVPTLYHKLLQAGIAGEFPRLGVRHCVSAGERLPPAVRAAWRAATGIEPVSGYGTTETLCLVLWTRDGRLLSRAPAAEVEFVPGEDAAGPGRVRVRHPALALGYWERPAEQEASFEAGWFTPGDRFARDASGNLEFCGRDDDMLKVSGQWVSTLAVEQALLEACGDALAEIGAAAVKTPEGFDAVAVFAVASAGREGEARARLDATVETLPGYRRPRYVRWVASLPRTPTGKLARARLRALFGEAA